MPTDRATVTERDRLAARCWLGADQPIALDALSRRFAAYRESCCAEAVREAREEGLQSVLMIRCTRHFTVPQQNTAEVNGAECGGCIAEERDLARVSGTQRNVRSEGGGSCW